MALSRRQLLQSLPVLLSAAGLVSGCAHGGPRRPSAPSYLELTRTAGPKPARILVLMPDTEQTRQVWTGLTDELAQEFQLIAVAIDSAGQADVVAQALHMHAPAALVLINNPTVAAYRAYQQRHSAASYPPAIIMMTSLLEEQNLGIENATGIRYEVPLVAVVTNLRRVLSTPIARVGVIRRNAFARLVQVEAAVAQREMVSLVSESVDNAPNASEMKAAIRRIKQRADALWILNDDKLLTPRLLADAWVPGLNETPYIPTIVGVRSLVCSASSLPSGSPSSSRTGGGASTRASLQSGGSASSGSASGVSTSASFGDFAVLPDHTALGAQAAAIVFDLMDSGWQLSGRHVQPPLSTTTVIDFVQASERFALRADALSQVDEILR